MKLGKAKYGAGKQFFKIKDGSQSFRILPPIGDLADEGVRSRYYRINYGYTNTDGKSRAFESSLVKNMKTKMVETPDAAVERFDKLKAAYEDAHKRGDTKSKEALLPMVGGPKSRYNVDSNHYMNAVDSQGNIGILKIRHKCKQQLDIAIRALRDKGIDPLGVETGRFFVFTRTGTRNETAFNVTVLKKTIQVANVGEVEQDVIHALDATLIKRLETEAGELDKLFKKPSAAEIEQIVRESDVRTGVSPNIDKILGFEKDDTTGDDGSDDDSETETTKTATVDPVAAALGQTTAAAAPAAAPAASAPAATTAPAAAQTASAPVPTAVEKPAPAAAAAPTMTPTTSEKLASQSDKDFLAGLGVTFN